MFSQKPRPAKRNVRTPHAGRIVIADDSELYRERLKMVIQALPGLEVLGSVGDGCQALEMWPDKSPNSPSWTSNWRPQRPQSLALIREYHPATRVIIIADDDRMT